MADLVVDYWGLRLAIAAAIRDDPDLAALPVFPERGSVPSPEELPCCLIYMGERSTSAGEQRIAAGLLLIHRVVFSVWVIHYSPQSLEDAVRLRDGLLGKVELALMRSTNLGGAVSQSVELEGGDVEWGSNGKSFFSSAIETRVICRVEARLRVT